MVDRAETRFTIPIKRNSLFLFYMLVIGIIVLHLAFDEGKGLENVRMCVYGVAPRRGKVVNKGSDSNSIRVCAHTLAINDNNKKHLGL